MIWLNLGIYTSFITRNVRMLGSHYLAKFRYIHLYTVPLKCNVTLARMYFPRTSIPDTLLSTNTRTNCMRVERGVESDVETRLVELDHSSEFALSLE